VHCSSRVSALRRELNNHDAASREHTAAAAKSLPDIRMTMRGFFEVINGMSR
jgi:hypothetical protein